MLRRLLLVLSVALSAFPSFSQTVQTGLYTYGSFDSPGFDTIDRGTLNVHLAFPIVSKQGRGLAFSYTIAYDGLIWSPTTVSGSTTWEPDATFGIHGYLLNDGYKGFLSYSTAVQSCLVGSRYIPISYSFNYAYHDQFGVKHPFNYAQKVTCTAGGPSISTTGNGAATDGSGYTYNGNVITPQGHSLNLPTYVNSGVSSTNATITDTNGNQVTNNQNGVFTDTTGNTALTISGTGTASSPKTFTYPTNGSMAATTLTYKNYTVQTSFGCSGVGEYNMSAGLVDRITLADGSYYQFVYEANGSNVTGRLASITLPGGGVISYKYSGVNCADGTPLTVTRTTSDGTRTYTRSSVTSTTSHTDIADAAGNHAEFDFVSSGSPAAFYETNEAWYKGAATGTWLMARHTCYNGASDPCLTTAITLPISQLDTYEIFDAIKEHGSTFLYNSSALQTEQDDYDFGGSTSRGALLRKEVWAYPSSGIANLLTTDTVYDGSGNQVSQLGYLYDGNSLTTTSGLPQHSGAIGSQRGNLTTVSQWLNTSGSSTTVQSNSYDDAGQIRSSTGLTGMTSYGYDSTDTFVTSTTLPTPSSGVAISLGAQYDIPSGVLLNTTDANENVTQYQNYDSFDRPTLITDPAGGQDFFGFNATWMGHDHNIDSSGARIALSTTYDGYGRVSKVTQANGQSQQYRVDTCYDSSGRTNFVSMPYFDSGGSNVCSGNGTATSYDALGRVSTITHADGSTIQYTYLGRDVKVVDENGVTRVQESDGLGRQSAVCEVTSDSTMPNSGSPQSCGLDIAATGFATTYAYELAAHETIVYQGTEIARAFITDSFGRTTIVQEPEMFTNDTNTLTNYSYVYNSTGLQATRTRPRANQTNSDTLTHTVTQYDSLGRVVSITYDDGTASRTYAYDTSGGISGRTNLVGQLTSASTTIAGQSTPSTVTQYSYDAMGRVLGMWECQPSTCGVGANTRQLGFTYDYAGRLLSQADPTTGTVNYTYSPANEISGITNSSYNDTYNPPTYISNVVNGPLGPTSYHTGNNLNEVVVYEAAGQVQNKWLCSGSTANSCSGGTQLYGLASQWRGPYLYTGTDTVMNTGGNYTYDDFGRLKSFTSTIGQASSFTWTYDRYGNRWSQTPGASVTYNAMNHKMDGSTTYDAAGNIIKDAAHSYAYDAENNLTSVDGGQTASYVYDALNQRVRINVPGAARPALEYTYDFAGRRITTWDANANFGIQGQAWWGSMPLVYRDVDGHTYFQQSDRGATQRLLTDYTGSVVSRYVSNPFGDGYSASGTDDNRAHYAGTEHDAESGTDHAQFRQYSTNVGIWMSMDPYLGSYDFTNPQSMNRYVYALNNPVSFLDPLGLDDCSQSSYDGVPCITQQPGSGSSCDTDPYASGCYGPITWPCLEYGYCYGSTGSAPGPTGGGPSTPAPPPPPPPHLATLSNAPNKSQINQQCLGQFNNSGVGKAANFFSLTSPLIGPDRLGSTIEDVGGSALKFGAYQFFKRASQTMVRTPFGSMSGFVSETIEAVATDAVFPAAVAATGIQLLAHAGCSNSALNATGQANIPANPGYF